MIPPGTAVRGPGDTGTSTRMATSRLNRSTFESLKGVPALRVRTRAAAYSGHARTGLPVPATPELLPGMREDGVEQATLARRVTTDDPRLSEDELRLLAQIATGVTADVAARKLELSARTLRRRLRSICDRLNVNTPIEAVVWAARRQLI